MKPATITLGAALFLVVGGSSAIILRQHAVIDELRARLDSATAVRAAAPATMSAEAVEAAGESTTMEDSPAPAAGVTVVRSTGTDEELAQRRLTARQRGADRFAELLADPEIATLMKNEQKAELDGRYAAIFKKLGLTGLEVEALKELLAEKQLARMEARVVARAEGLGGNDRDAIRDLVDESDVEVDARIAELLGPDRHARLQRYESTGRERSRVGQLDQRLSYTTAPLQPYQSDALVDIFAAVEEPSVRLRSPEEAVAYLGELEAYNAAIYRRAQAVLSPAQLEALRQMQIERQSQARLGMLMRRRGEGGG